MNLPGPAGTTTKAVWVVRIKSESGDDYGAVVFDFEPTDEQLRIFCLETYPGDFDPDEPDGPGNWGSYLHIAGPYQQVVFEKSDFGWT